MQILARLCLVFTSSFMTFFDARALWFDELRNIESMTLYARGKSKIARSHKETPGQIFAPEWENLMNAWLLLPILYADEEQKRDEIDESFKQIEHLEDILQESKKNTPTTSHLLQLNAEGKYLKYLSFSKHEGPQQEYFLSISFLWEDLSQKTPSIDEYENTRKAARQIKLRLRFIKFGGFLPPRTNPIITNPIRCGVFDHPPAIQRSEIITNGLAPVINQGGVHQQSPLFTKHYFNEENDKKMRFILLKTDREVKEVDYLLWADSLKKMENDFKKDLTGPVPSWFESFFVSQPKPPTSETKSKWINRRALIDYTRDFLKLNRAQAIKVLDEIGLI